MSEKSEPLLYIIAGLAVGALAVFIYLTQTNKTTITEMTRDADGHIISIVERRV